MRTTCPHCHSSAISSASVCGKCKRSLGDRVEDRRRQSLERSTNGGRQRDDQPSADLTDYAKFATLSAQALLRHASAQASLVDAVQAGLLDIGRRLDGLDVRFTESQRGVKDVAARVERLGTRLPALTQDLAASRSAQAQASLELSAKLGKLELDMQTFGPEAEAARHRQLARSLSVLWADTVANVSSEDDRTIVVAVLQNFASDFGLDVDLPEPGTQFDPLTMQPASSRSASIDPADAVVSSISAPVLARDGVILQCAQVRLTVPGLDSPSGLPAISGSKAATIKEPSHE